jgi:Mg2+/citrate symporter
MRELVMVYVCGVILLLAVSTTIGREEKVRLDHIFIAAFGWPILTPILALRAWSSR